MKVPARKKGLVSDDDDHNTRPPSMHKKQINSDVGEKENSSVKSPKPPEESHTSPQIFYKKYCQQDTEKKSNSSVKSPENSNNSRSGSTGPGNDEASSSSSHAVLLSTVLKNIERRYEKALANRTLYSVDHTEDFSRVSVEITTDNPEYAKRTTKVKDPRYFYNGALKSDMLEDYHVVGLEEDETTKNLRKLVEDLFANDLDNRSIYDTDFLPDPDATIADGQQAADETPPSGYGCDPGFTGRIEDLLDRFFANAKEALACEELPSTFGQCYGEIYEENIPVQEVFTTVMTSEQTMDKNARLEAFKKDFQVVDFQSIISRIRTRSEGGSLSETTQTTVSTLHSDIETQQTSLNPDAPTLDRSKNNGTPVSGKKTPSPVFFTKKKKDQFESKDISEKEVNLVTAALSKFAKNRKVSLESTLRLLAEDFSIQKELSKKKVQLKKWIPTTRSNEKKEQTPVAQKSANISTYHIPAAQN